MYGPRRPPLVARGVAFAPAHLRLLVAFVLVASAGVASAQATSGAADDATLFAARGPAQRVTSVTARGDAFSVSRRQGDALRWTHDLPARPNFLAASDLGGTVAVGHLRNDGSARWAMVIADDGTRWSPPGEVQGVHVSKQGDKVYAEVRVDGEARSIVFDQRGRELDRFDIPQGPEKVAQFTSRGDAIAVTPGPEDTGSTIEIFEIGTGRFQRLELDPGVPIEDAVALDADHVVVLGGGALTMVVFSRAEEFAEESTFAWTLQPDDGPGYSTLLGSTADGERLLATRLFGLFDVVGRGGDVLWSFDPRDPAVRQRLPEIDFGRVQPFLRGDGVVELTDGSGRGRYLLSWPETSGRLGTPRIAWQPAG